VGARGQGRRHQAGLGPPHLGDEPLDGVPPGDVPSEGKPNELPDDELRWHCSSADPVKPTHVLPPKDEARRWH
jgi:hypothetical protein